MSMTHLTLKTASLLVDVALGEGAKLDLKPLCVVVLDAGGHVLVLKRDERASLYRGDIATAKAAGCLGMGFGARALGKRITAMPAFYASIGECVGRPFVNSPGGVLIRDEGGQILGAVGISGDTGENDEACCVAGIVAAGLVADCG